MVINMNSLKVINIRKINGDYFYIYKNTSKSCYDFDLIIDEIKYNDYYIYKLTNKQKEVSIEEFKEFKNSGYIFFRKDLYNKEWIDMWIEFIISIGGIQYLNKTFPPIHPSKINILK